MLIIKSSDLLEKELIIYLPRDAANQNRDLRGMYFSDSEIDLSQYCVIKGSEVGLCIPEYRLIDQAIIWDGTTQIGSSHLSQNMLSWKGPTRIIQSHSRPGTEPSPGVTPCA